MVVKTPFCIFSFAIPQLSYSRQIWVLGFPNFIFSKPE